MGHHQPSNEATSRNITEQDKAAEKLATLGHAIESTSEMICITDLEDRFTFVNRAFAATYGYAPEEILGKTPDILFSSNNRPGLLAEILFHSRRGGWRGEVIDRRKDGSEFPVFLITSQVRDQAGRVIGLMGIAQDITERKRAEADLQDAKARLQAHTFELESVVEQRTAKLREMVGELHHVSYAMIHDMRGPLRAMCGFAQLLARSGENLDPAQARDYARRIEVAATRLDSLIMDALNYTKVLNEPLPVEPVDLSRLIRDLIESYPNLRPEAVQITVEEPLPTVLGSESLLTQCFSNLLGNAAKFVPPGARPQIRVRAESALNPFVRVWVEDNGVGIPDSVRNRLFGLFQRFNTNYEGTGMGLAIVRKVAERMGGSVGVESEEGKGSRFWVQLREVGAKQRL